MAPRDHEEHRGVLAGGALSRVEHGLVLARRKLGIDLGGLLCRVHDRIEIVLDRLAGLPLEAVGGGLVKIKGLRWWWGGATEQHVVAASKRRREGQ